MACILKCLRIMIKAKQTQTCELSIPSLLIGLNVRINTRIV